MPKSLEGIPHQKCVEHLQGDLEAYAARDHRAAPAEDIRQVMGVDDPGNRIDGGLKEVENISAKWSKEYRALGKYIVKME